MADPRRAASIIIKRKKVVAGGGHHGGAWKVAYADFVTAMMAAQGHRGLFQDDDPARTDLGRW
jgi:hypothetical protein